MTTRIRRAKIIVDIPLHQSARDDVDNGAAVAARRRVARRKLGIKRRIVRGGVTAISNIFNARARAAWLRASCVAHGAGVKRQTSKACAVYHRRCSLRMAW